jgi:hypothetical protein
MRINHELSSIRLTELEFATLRALPAQRQVDTFEQSGLVRTAETAKQQPAVKRLCRGINIEPKRRQAVHLVRYTLPVDQEKSGWDPIKKRLKAIKRAGRGRLLRDQLFDLEIRSVDSAFGRG